MSRARPARGARRARHGRLDDRRDPVRPGARGRAESVFAVGNGYLGLRGAPEEGTPAHDPASSSTASTRRGRSSIPRTRTAWRGRGRRWSTSTDGTIVRLFVDDEPFDLTTARVLALERVLDMRTGVLSREVEFETPRGHADARALPAARVAGAPARGRDPVRGRGARRADAIDGLVRARHPGPRGGADDPRRGRGFAEKVLVPLGAPREGTRAVLRLATRNSGLELACGMEHVVDGGRVTSAAAAGDARGGRRATPTSAPGRPLRRRQVRRLPLGRAPRRSRRARRAHARPGRRRRLRRDRGRAHGARRGVLAARRRRGRGPGRRPGGGPLQPVRADAGDRARRGPRRRRPRASPAAATRATTSGTRRSTSSRSSRTRARSWARQVLAFRCGMLDAARAARARGRPRRRAVPVAHDHGRRGLGVVRGRHGAVPHQRRHRVRDAPVQPGHRRPRVHARAGRGGGRRDRALLDGARLLLRAPGRALLHPQRDRARTSTRRSSTTTPTRT